QEVDIDLVIPDKSVSLNDHAIRAWEPISSDYYPQLLKAVCAHYDIDMYQAVKDIPKKQLNKILYGSGKEYIDFHYVNDFGTERKNRIQFEGVLRNIERSYHETSSDFIRETLEKYMSERNCSTSRGYILIEEAMAMLLQISDIKQDIH